MTRPTRRWWLLVALLLLLGAARAAWRRLDERPPPDSQCTATARAPRLEPDYTDLVIPPNIAPLNFMVVESGRRYLARLTDGQGRTVAASSRNGVMIFPLKGWHRLLAANRGRELRLDVWARADDGRWNRYQPVRQTVAAEPVENYLAYRRFRPFYDSSGPMGIYQRDLRGFDETAIATRDDIGDGCLNCHSFHDRRADSFVFHTRLFPGDPAMVVVRGSQAQAADTRVGGSGPPAGYSSWHPNGQTIAFSRNRILQYYPQADRAKAALDVASSLAVYTVATGQVTVPPEINPPGRLPTFPCWSADGRWLYFATAPRLWPESSYMPVAQQKNLRYDIARAAYDQATGRFGSPETVVSARTVGGSALEPRISPDGRFLLFCLCEAGTFPVFQERSDLYLLDLTRPGAQPVALESTAPTRHDSWHSWSGNSRWIVCASKRDNNLLARPYLRYVDAAGVASKPFVVPRSDPRLHERETCTFNVPELVDGPIRVGRTAVRRATTGSRRAAPTGQSGGHSAAEG
ncbi:MAG: PD40 domain-containing protein [Armatimonadetes bacterium]|nr:PD40 domain-containing protein [Armatimonadota bacterium]